MKILMILALLCAFVSADAQTYRAGESSRPSFGASDTEPEGEEDSSVPGARSNIQTRTLSSYSSRQRDWSKGVQTQTVKTDTAGSKSFDDNASSQASQAVKAIQNRTDGTQQSSSSKSAPDSAAAGQAAAKNLDTPSATTAGNPQNPAAMLQQVQGMMQGLNGMMGAMGGGAAGSSSSNTSNAKGNQGGMPTGMNAPGMPDMSALLNAVSAGGQQPASK